MEELDTTKVDLRPLFEAGQKGKERPLYTTIGNPPAWFNPFEYIKEARKFFYIKSVYYPSFTEEHHFWFISWYEYNSLEDQYRNEYAFALRGIGLYPHEQKERFDFWSLAQKEVYFSPPAKNYYPMVLPLAAFELLKQILLLENPTRKFRHNLFQLARLSALLWQSKRIDGIPKRLALNYMKKYIRTNRQRTIRNLTLLEKYELAECTLRSQTNEFWTKIPDRPLYPLILTAPHPYPPLVKSGPDSGYFFGDLFESLYGKREYLKFIPDAHRRHLFSAAQRIPKKDPNAGKPWPVYQNMGQQIEQKREIMKAVIPNLSLDRAYLKTVIDKLQDEINTLDKNEKRKAKADLRLCEELLSKGIASTFELTRSGRLKTGRIANHLNTSISAGKFGHHFWRAIQTPLWIIDIRNAEVLIAAILTRDERLFKDYCEGDIYEQAMKALQAEDRSLIKKIWLAAQYGQSLENVDEEDKDTAKPLRSYLRNFYPCYWKNLNGLRRLGFVIRERGYSMKLPHGSPASIYPDKGYALPALVMQSLVACLITEFFLILDQEGFKPVFDFHDAVLCSGGILREEGSEIILPLIEELIRRHGLSWNIKDVNVIKVEQLEHSQKVIYQGVVQDLI